MNDALDQSAKVTMISLSAAALVLFTPGTANSAIFADDFETYASFSDIIGQGGWTGAGGPMLISTVGPLSTNILDGISPAPNSVQHFAGHALPVPAAGQITVFSFDGFASTSSANSWAGLSADASGALSYAVVWDFPTASGWQLEIRQAGQPTIGFSPGVGPNSISKFKIYFDRAANEVWGSYDIGSGAVQTPKYALASASFDQLDTINISFDYRGTRGIQVDNLSVTAVPEPSAALLLLIGVGILAVRKPYSHHASAGQA